MTSFFRDGWNPKASAGWGALDLARVRTHTNFGGSRVNVGDKGIFGEVDVTSSSIRNAIAAGWNGSGRL